MISTAKAAAHPNIAFIKYWGNRDHQLRIPANSSLSMNLAGLETQTTVSFDTDMEADQLTINGEQAAESALAAKDFHSSSLKTINADKKGLASPTIMA